MNSSYNPEHIAIIMDGNGRWAKERRHLRMWGHVRGAKVVSNIIEEAVNLKIKALTLYTFSTENWSRPEQEITTLFKLLKKFLLLEKNKILKQNVRFRVMGDYSDFPTEVLDVIEDITIASEHNTGLKMTLALGYGSRCELVSVVNKLITDNSKKIVTEDDIQNALYIPDLGNVDLMIRTGGDHRLSNFLLWQMAYAEFFFSDTQWPNFKANEFRSIINNFAKRERRFGNVDRSLSLDDARADATSNRKSIVATKM